MTCIAGLVDENGDIYMGGDSAAVAGYCLTPVKNIKVFINGEFIIGYTSSFRMGQLLQYSFTPPKLTEGQDIMQYMVNEFVNSIRTLFKTAGYIQIDKGEEIGGFFLVGFRGRLFHIQSDFQVSESIYPYNATGCGEAYALSVLHTTIGVTYPPEARVRLALQTAADFNAGVRGPFNILKLESKK
jgi:hypothetical protein